MRRRQGFFVVSLVAMLCWLLNNQVWAQQEDLLTTYESVFQSGTDTGEQSSQVQDGPRTSSARPKKPALLRRVYPGPAAEIPSGTVGLGYWTPGPKDRLFAYCKGDPKCVGEVMRLNPQIKNANHISVGARIIVPVAAIAALVPVSNEVPWLKMRLESLEDGWSAMDGVAENALVVALGAHAKALNAEAEVLELRQELTTLRETVRKVEAREPQAVNAIEARMEAFEKRELQREQGMAQLGAQLSALAKAGPQQDQRIGTLESRVGEFPKGVVVADRSELRVAQSQSPEDGEGRFEEWLERVKASARYWWAQPGAKPGAGLFAALLVLVAVLIYQMRRRVYADRTTEKIETDIVDVEPLHASRSYILDTDLLEEIPMDVRRFIVDYPIEGIIRMKGRQIYKLRMEPGCGKVLITPDITKHHRECFECKFRLSEATGLTFKGIDKKVSA